jgi:fructosamine-3-kinase
VDLTPLLTAHGFTCSQLTPVSTGKFNTTVLGRCREHDIIIRIAPDPDKTFLFYERNMMAQEPEIHHIVRENTTLPVPEIYIYDSTRRYLDRDVLIEEAMPGTPVSECSLPADVRDRMEEQMGRFLRELHDRCQRQSYGYLGNHNPMPPHENWTSAFAEMWNRLIDDIVSVWVYTTHQGNRARQALTKNLHHFTRTVPASLLHMDIWDQNILVDMKGNVSGILDWDRALWGDPEIEFAVLDYCGYNTKAFWRGYGTMPEQTPSARIRMTFYHLYEVQKYLVIWSGRPPFRPLRVDPYKTYSLGLVDQLFTSS